MLEENKKLNKRLSWLIIVVVSILLVAGIGVMVLLKREGGFLERVVEFKASLTPEGVIPQKGEIEEIPPTEEIPLGESREISSETPMELEGVSNKKTDTFSVGKGEWMISFYIILDDFPSSDKIPSYRISLYQVGKENPVLAYQNEISIDVLKEFGWSPTFTSPGASEPPGTAGGITGPIFEGPGEFYFKIEVRNVDRWILKVTAGSRG